MAALVLSYTDAAILAAAPANVDKIDEAQLASLGYTQELRRTMSFWGAVGLALASMQPLVAGGVLSIGLAYGGPVVVVWGFVGCFIGCSFLTLSMSETLSGKWGKLPPFVCGWVIVVALMGGSASLALQTMQAIVAMNMIRNAGDPASSFTQEAQFGIACGLVVVSATIALLPTKSINVICKFCLYIVVFGCALIIVVIPAIAPTHQPSSFVFGHWQNGDASGIGSQIKTSTGRDAYTAQYIMTVFDGPGHMAEEIKHASWSVPRAIVVTFFLGSILAFGLLLSFLYSIQIPLNVVVPGYGITNTVYGTPDSPIGATIFTVSNLFYDVFAARYPDASGLPDLNCSAAAGGVCPPRASRTGQNGAIFFTFIIWLAIFGSQIQSVVSASRFLYSFTRDRGIPFPILARVNATTAVPVYSVFLFAAGVIGFVCSWLNNNPIIAWSAVTGITSNGVLFTYGFPSFLRITASLRTFKGHPDFSLGRWSIPVAVLGVTYVLASQGTIALPTYFPITSPGGDLGGNLNYAPVALGSVIFMALLFYPLSQLSFWGYTGPKLHSAQAGLHQLDSDGKVMSEEDALAMEAKLGSADDEGPEALA